MKLIDLLVKELPKRGGWPEKVTHIGQDYDRELMLYGRGNVRSGIIIDELAIDHRKCGDFGVKITREQYESALAVSEGWIEWGGGECPVKKGTLVDVRFRDGDDDRNIEAIDLLWNHENWSADIIAYRLRKPDINFRANDDRLEQDLNECIGQDVDMPEWNGEGLPPVGYECEISFSGESYRKCTVLFTSKRTVLVAHDTSNDDVDNEEAFAPEDVQFRPLRTESEKAREDAETAMRTCLAGTGAGITPLAAKGIYEAIAAGKIPGVKIDK